MSTRNQAILLLVLPLVLLYAFAWWLGQRSPRINPVLKAKPGDTLTVLTEQLAVQPPNEAVTTLVKFLNSGKDGITGQPFAVGVDGQLTSVPTLRVWALDRLGALDLVAAVKLSSGIYANSNSPDEWAIAMRNDWRSGMEMARVKKQFLDLINRDDWAGSPSIGFLEALDFCVATLSWEAVPKLEAWLGCDSIILRHGAWVTLDRLTMEVPTDFLPEMMKHPDWLQAQPMVRAGLMARADLSVATERAAVEAYLGREDLSAQEVQRFLEIIPNGSATVSRNLVSGTRLVTPQNLARLDRLTSEQITVWLDQQKFPRWETEMRTAQHRLRGSVAAAQRGGL